MKENNDIRAELKKYDITYAQILHDVGYAHTQRIVEELAKPMTEERKQVYLLAIKNEKERKRKLYED